MNDKIEISRRPSVIHLFLSFLKLGLTAFGGLAMIAYIKELSVNKNKWIDEDSFKHGLALCQTLPGPMVVNTTSYIGLRLRGLPLEGVLGSVVGTLAVFFPGSILVTVTLPIFDKLKSSRYFMRATRGILASFVGLLLFVAIKFALAVPWDVIKVVLGLAALTALVKKVDILYVVLIGAVISVLIF